MSKSQGTSQLINKASIEVDSIASLIALDTDVFTKVNVNAFYSDTPWGFSRLFEWDSSQAKTGHDGWSIINPDHLSTIGSANWYSASGDSTPTGTNGCWVRDTEDVTIKEFGAKGDNTNDDSYAVRACFQALPYAKFTTGTYLLSSWDLGFAVLSKDFKIYAEQGEAVEVVGPNDGTSFIEVDTSDTILKGENIKFSKWRYVFWDNTANFKNVKILNCESSQCTRLVDVQSGTDTVITVSGNHIYDGRNGAGAIGGIRVQGTGCKKITIEDNIIEDMDAVTNTEGRVDAILVELNDGSFSGHASIKNNTITNMLSESGSRANGIWLYRVESGEISGNKLKNIYDGDKSGISYGVSVRSRNVTTENNTLIDAGWHVGFYTKGQEYYGQSIVDNEIIYDSKTPDRAIWLLASNIECSRNYIVNAPDAISNAITEDQALLDLYGENVRTRINDNQIFNTDKGIRTNLVRGVTEIKNNYIEIKNSPTVAYGIDVRTSAYTGLNGDFRKCIVNNNTIEDGIMILQSLTHIIDLMSITANNIKTTSTYAIAGSSNTATISDFIVSGNNLDYGTRPANLVGLTITNLTWNNDTGFGFKSGIATITNGTTSVNITYDRPFNASSYTFLSNEMVDIGFAEDSGSASSLWVTNLDNNGFTINCDTDPGQDVDVYYTIDFARKKMSI